VITMTETTTTTRRKIVKLSAIDVHKFKPSTHSRKLKLKVIPPQGGISIEDLDSIGDIIKVDVWEKNIKIGRYRLKDIKAKFG
jgi:hypothetical protein